MFANTPKPPYYAVIFTSVRKDGGIKNKDYEDMAERMTKLAVSHEGFIGIESVRGATSLTVTYWTDMESIQKWRENVDHTMARELGRTLWYKSVVTRIALVERDFSFDF